MDKNREVQSSVETITEERTCRISSIPDKEAYLERINALSPEDQSFLDGYLFAKVTEAARRGA